LEKIVQPNLRQRYTIREEPATRIPRGAPIANWTAPVTATMLTRSVAGT